MNQQEELARLQALKDQLVKVKTEVVTAVQVLTDKLNNAGTVSPEIEAALADVGTAAQGLDDLNPDTPAATPPVGG